MFSFKRIFYYVWPEIQKHSGLLYAVLIIFGFRVANDIIRPIYFKKIVDVLSSNPLDRMATAETLFGIAAILVALHLFSGVAARVGKHFHYLFEINAIRDLRNLTFRKIEQHSQAFFANTFAGSLVTKSRRFVGSFELMFDIFIYNFWNVFIVLVGALFVLAHESVLIAGLFLLWAILYVTIVLIFVRRKIKYDILEAKSDSRIGGALADVFGNNLAVKTFSAHDREATMFRQITIEAAAAEKAAWFFSNRIDILQSILIFFTQSIVLYSMIKLWLAGTITTGTVVLVQTYAVILFDRMWDLGNSLTRFMKSAADMQEMVQIFDTDLDIKDPVHPEALAIQNGHLIFDHVSFAYTEGKEILSDFNLDVAPGERIGLVGPSGAGKSTITKLLLRFTDITSGEITIDKQNIHAITQDDLRNTISYIPQEPVLFHRSLKENIAYGKPDATMEEIINAAKHAHAHEFISDLPLGYDTLVGERGVKLSGGERQRIAIARAILKNAPILVLDEATSSLDSHSESLIQDALEELMKGKTTIVIAHRLSTIRKMDRIIVLEHGKIIEEGTHEKLLKKRGSLYKKLWNLQAGGFVKENLKDSL